MALRRALLPRGWSPRALVVAEKHSRPPVCLFCSLALPAGGRRRRRDTAVAGLAIIRAGGTAAMMATASATKAAPPPPAANPAGAARAELERALAELQNEYPDLVNLSRFELARQGLRRPPGQEVVRVAVLGLAAGGAPSPAPMARRLLRALVADPLVDEEGWEQILERHDASRPLIVRLGPAAGPHVQLRAASESDTALPELLVSSPTLNKLNLEFLLMPAALPRNLSGPPSCQSLEDSMLVPVISIPSAGGRFAPLTAPVHQSLLVVDGFPGALEVASLPMAETEGSIVAAVQVFGLINPEKSLEGSIQVVDVSLAEEAIQLFRQGPHNAMDYERLWSASNLSTLVSWLKASAETSAENTKPAVRRLIASLLRRTLSTVQKEEARRALTTGISRPLSLAAMNQHLADWAERAHSELRDELDLAFASPTWRKLDWWKLFWRVDDVAMLTSELLSQRFLPTAQQELVFLAGRIAELGPGLPIYSQPSSRRGEDDKLYSLAQEQSPSAEAASWPAPPKWPRHIAFTRRYLEEETVPALQSLAQRLVLQSVGTCSLTASLAALLYLSSWTATLYGAGAVAALGLVYSLRRIQRKWEAARRFWEGDVREEGRKAVRATEESIATVLERRLDREPSDPDVEELRRARELVAKAEDALTRMK